MAQPEFRIKIHETAYVDPTVILQGNITVGPWSRIKAGTVILGNVTIGEHTTIHCNVAIRTGMKEIKIGNYVQIYDSVCIEGGRPANRGSAGPQGDQTIIKDWAWVNHGAVLHGSEIGEGAVLGLNATLDYACKIGDGAVVANGSACPFATVVPDNCVAEGVPARIVRRDITDEDRLRMFGLIPREDAIIMAQTSDAYIKEMKGL